MTGWKTFFVGLLMAIVPAMTDYLGAIDWDSLMSPNTAFFVSGAIMLILRFVSTTPMFQKKE